MAFAALVGWTGLSVLWSSGPDLSWIAFDVAALYLLVMAAVGVLPGGPLQLRFAAYGLRPRRPRRLGLRVPRQDRPGRRHARATCSLGSERRSGYWNVLAALVVMAVPVFLVIASRREGRDPGPAACRRVALVLLAADLLLHLLAWRLHRVRRRASVYFAPEHPPAVRPGLARRPGGALGRGAPAPARLGDAVRGHHRRRSARGARATCWPLWFDRGAGSGRRGSDRRRPRWNAAGPCRRAGA